MKHFSFSVLSLLLFTTISSSSFCQSAQSKRDRMVNGIVDLDHYNKWINRPYAYRLVKEATEVVSMPGNRWMPVERLLGLAFNESDLKADVQSGPSGRLVCKGKGKATRCKREPYSPDCGICQNHVASFAKSDSARRALCKRLKHSTKLSFIYAMRELNNDVRKPYCGKRYKKPSWHVDEASWHYAQRLKRYRYNFYRCLFDVYNQGPSYFFSRKKRECDYKDSHRRFACYYRNRYWLRTLCFGNGIKLGRAPRKRTTCRKVYGIHYLEWMYTVPR